MVCVTFQRAMVKDKTLWEVTHFPHGYKTYPQFTRSPERPNRQRPKSTLDGRGLTCPKLLQIKIGDLYGDFTQLLLKDSQLAQFFFVFLFFLGGCGLDEGVQGLIENSLQNAEAGALCLLLSTDERSI